MRNPEQLPPAHRQGSWYGSIRMSALSRSLRLICGCTIFLGAFLLFAVEPMAAKRLLPALGGSSAVWITCLVFFQTALLLGYLYAHWLGRRSSLRQAEL